MKLKLIIILFIVPVLLSGCIGNFISKVDQAIQDFVSYVDTKVEWLKDHDLISEEDYLEYRAARNKALQEWEDARADLLEIISRLYRLIPGTGPAEKATTDIDGLITRAKVLLENDHLTQEEYYDFVKQLK